MRGKRRRMPKSAKLTKRNLHPDAKEAARLWGMEAMAKRLESIPHFAMETPRISVQMLSYWGVVAESLESVYDLVDEIIVAHGPCPEAKRINDGSLDRIRAFPDPGKKIRIEVRDEWRDKKAMRQYCSDQSSGNFCLVLDGDEVWVGLQDLIDSGVLFGSPRWLNLWHGGGHWVYDSQCSPGTSDGGQRWGFKVEPHGSYNPHYRWSWWRASYHWYFHSMPAGGDSQLLFTKNSTVPPRSPTSESESCAHVAPGCVIYHLGHALPREIMLAKHNFYRKRDGDDAGRRERMRAWHEWNGKTGDCGDGWVARVDWKLPDIVKRALRSAEGIRVR